VAGIAVAGLITYFIITELSRDNPAPRPLSSSPPAAAPAPAPAPFPRVDTAPLELAVRENPNDRQALLRLANALHDNGGWVRAIEVYKQYLALDPSNPDARVDMAVCYFELAKSDTLHGTALFDTAIKEMEAVVKRTSTHQPAVFNLGVINLTLGRMKESNRWFRRAVELDTTSELGRRAQNILEQHATITQP
jgi:tetratricopeptide (TPR) repeat protein